MLILIEHNSNEIVDVFVGKTEAEVLQDFLSRYEYQEELLEENEIDTFTLESLTDICHDGDSTNGFTLISKEFNI